jgi:hypothetical protein
MGGPGSGPRKGMGSGRHAKVTTKKMRNTGTKARVKKMYQRTVRKNTNI